MRGTHLPELLAAPGQSRAAAAAGNRPKPSLRVKSPGPSPAQLMAGPRGALLAWCRRQCEGYRGVDIRDLSSSFRAVTPWHLLPQVLGKEVSLRYYCGIGGVVVQKHS